jgi:hypothetical protein
MTCRNPLAGAWRSCGDGGMIAAPMRRACKRRPRQQRCARRWAETH